MTKQELRKLVLRYVDKFDKDTSGKKIASDIVAECFLKDYPECDIKIISLIKYVQKARNGKLEREIANQPPSREELLDRIKGNIQEAERGFGVKKDNDDVSNIGFSAVPNIGLNAPTIHFERPLRKIIETESNYQQLKEFWDNKLFRLFIFSDTHGWLVDLRATRCINKVLQQNKFDEVCVNGDIVDLPYLSRHTKKLYEDGILNGYSEVKEMIYTKEQILDPLRLSTKAKIRIRTGNHCARIIKPNVLSDAQLARLAILHKHFNTTEYDKMLGLNPNDGFIYDPSTVYTYFDKFDVVHGLSLAKNASEKNIQEYMSSGSSGHTHRLNSKFLTNRKAPYVWFESGHTRIDKEVEYFPTGKIPDWQQGFVTVSFLEEDNEVRFFAHATNIIDGRCMFNGVVYDGN